jgi:hypothetical protein
MTSKGTERHSTSSSRSDTERRKKSDREGRSAFDATHDSSARGEHRYPDEHQTTAEQNTRQTRDDLKRKLTGAR